MPGHFFPTILGLGPQVAEAEAALADARRVTGCLARLWTGQQWQALCPAGTIMAKEPFSRRVPAFQSDSTTCDTFFIYRTQPRNSAEVEQVELRSALRQVGRFDEAGFNSR